MAMYKSYQCPDCEGTFEFLHHPSTEPPPNFCPLCGANVSGGKKRGRKRKLEQVITNAPSIRSNMFRSEHQVYRTMEKASEARMEMAAQAAGMDKSEFSNMKVTNMKDNLREGDTSAVTQSYSPATEIKGAPVAGTFNTGEMINSNFGLQGASAAGGNVPYKPSGVSSPQLSTAMNNVFANHQRIAAVTEASGMRSKK